MSIERELFQVLEPPPGGVERMRARLAGPEPRNAVFGLPTFGVVALFVLAALLVYRPAAPPRPAVADAILAAPELDRLLGRESRPMPLAVERNGERVQTEELPSSDPSVRIYRVL